MHGSRPELEAGMPARGERRGPAEGRLDLPSWGLDGCRKEGEAVVSYSPRSESRLFLQAVTPSTIVKGK